jgi:putative transposase
MSNRNDKKLVLDALDMALICRKPRSELIHHTDRGAVYASDEYCNRLANNKLVASMSRKGDCYDNAVAESFFSTLKNELLWKNMPKTREQARTMIFEYIEIFYNRQRVHQSLSYLTPEQVDNYN